MDVANRPIFTLTDPHEPNFGANYARVFCYLKEVSTVGKILIQ